MRRSFASLSLTLIVLAGCHATQKPKPSVPPELAWAYPQAPKSGFPDPGAGPFRLPGSSLSFTKAQIEDDAHIVDWYPREHPQPPSVVDASNGHDSTPCGACHMPSGVGFLSPPDLAGLPATYIAEQVRAFRSGDRKPSLSDWPAAKEMIEVAKQVSDSGLTQAAAYFSALPRITRYRVIESDTVPATKPDHYGWHDLVPGRPKEPIAGRIIEVPENVNRLFLRDGHARILAYVPTGAIASGQALVRSGGPGGLPCTSCHGSDLRGTGGTPPLAGRSAAYLARQLWDIRTGARGGPSVALMQNVVANLAPNQIRDIAAYLSSRDP